MVFGILEPSVAQPPLPLQLFLPLQPLSLDLQPPLPLQSFLPAQECLSFLSLSALASSTLLLVLALAEVVPSFVLGVCAAAEPANRPVIAALNRRAFIEVLFILCFLSKVV